MLPVSVLIPTRNSMSLLPRHLESVGHWKDLVDEIIVVDSASHDGTWDLLRAKLPAQKTQFFQHPPGLYQSWNFGIQRATARYLYVSTVGDKITRDGLVHLVETAEQFASDVIVSPPGFVSERGEPVESNPWPVHRLISLFELQRPVCFAGLVPFICALSYIPFAILGSSASNLYRTATLQERPFPTDYGANGDGAWGVFNALDVRFAITPQRMSFFRKHRRPYRSDLEALEPEERMLAAGLRLWAEARLRRTSLESEAARLGVDRLIEAKCAAQGWRSKLVRYRAGAVPWFLFPGAWIARARRDRAQSRCDALLRDMLKRAFSPESDARTNETVLT